MSVQRILLCGLAVVALLLLSAAPAWAYPNWTGGGVGDDWMTTGNWDTGTIPGIAVLEKAKVAGGGTAEITSVVPNITDLDIETGGTIIVKNGGVFNAGQGGDYDVRLGDGNAVGHINTMIQEPGSIVTMGVDLYIADDDNDVGEYYLKGGSLDIGDDLKLGDDGVGLFDMSGGQLTVHGYVALTNKGSPSFGTMKISGGSLTQIGIAGGGGNDRFIVAESGPGTLEMTGGLATINVSNFEQTANGTFDVIMDGSGISTINAVGVNAGGGGTMTLAGDLNVSFAAGDPPPLGIYDLIVADSRTGMFDNVNAPPTALVTYETGSEIVRITVVPEPSTLLLAAAGLLALVPFLRRRYRRKAA